MNDFDDIEEVARALFSVRTSEKPELERQLVRAGGKSVMPLLKAIIFVTSRQKKMTEDLAKKWNHSIFGESEGRYIWAKVTLEQVVLDATNILKLIGQSATDELCSALSVSDHNLRLATALIMCIGNYVGVGVEKAAQNAVNNIGPNKKEGVTLMLLGLILANNGKELWRNLIIENARENGIDFDRWAEKTINTGLIELQKSK